MGTFKEVLPRESLNLLAIIIKRTVKKLHKNISISFFFNAILVYYEWLMFYKEHLLCCSSLIFSLCSIQTGRYTTVLICMNYSASSPPTLTVNILHPDCLS